MSATPEVIDPLLLEMWMESERLVAQANEQLAKARGARAFVKAKVDTKYGLGELDRVDSVTGAITRVAPPAPKDPPTP